MGATRKSYTPKYRQVAARLVIDTGRTIGEVAREMGLSDERCKRRDTPTDWLARRSL